MEFFQHVIVDIETCWCISEKFYCQGTEHGLVRYYPVNDGLDQLVHHIIISLNISMQMELSFESLAGINKIISIICNQFCMLGHRCIGSLLQNVQGTLPI